MTRNKYGAKKIEIDGYVFASQAEGLRYWELKHLERAGEIRGLTMQPAFPIIVNDTKVATYKADFAYEQDGQQIVEDVKGVKTPTYRLKKKLVEAIYGIEITEVPA